MAVGKLVIQRTGTYNQQFLRPFQANTTGEVINSIVQDSQRKNALMPADFAVNGASAFITQSATPESPIAIANGWETPRLRYMLELVHESQMGQITRIFVSGSTEYSDLSHMGSIDPRMRFFINSITKTSSVVVGTANGAMESTRVTDTSQVLVNRDYEGIDSRFKPISLQPENIFMNWENADLKAQDPSSMMLDTRQTLNGQPILNKRSNSVAPQYCSAILNTFLQVSQNEDMTHDQHLVQCEGIVRSKPAAEDAFISYLMDRRRQYGQSYINMFDNTFTLEDLIALDPNTPNVMGVSQFVDGTHQTGLTAGWGGSDILTQTASMLAQSVPSYMAQQFINFTEFSCTNMYTVNSELVMTISDAKSMNTGLSPAAIMAFQHRVVNELLAGLTYNNQIAFNLVMRVDMFGETWIELSMNGEPAVVYCAPTFADALTTPVITLNPQVLEGITYSVNQIADTIWEHNPHRRSLSLTGDVHI
jgi:hypothetical protein